jgi:hypothetical protein
MRHGGARLPGKMPASIYKSPEGRAEILRLYDEAVARLSVEREDLTVGMRFGDTRVLAIGTEDAPPVVVLPGSSFLNPTCLGWFLPLAEEHRLYAPDIIGQPGKIAHKRPRAGVTATRRGSKMSWTAWGSNVRRSPASPTALAST